MLTEPMSRVEQGAKRKIGSVVGNPVVLVNSLASVLYRFAAGSPICTKKLAEIFRAAETICLQQRRRFHRMVSNAFLFG